MIKIYLIVSFIWAVFAFYKHRVSYPAPLNSWTNCIYTAFINFLVFPYAFMVALLNGKISNNKNKNKNTQL